MIAVIDDDRSVREATTELLESLGYRAISFASAEDFLQSGVRDRTACLISDVRMPGMNGMDLHTRLTADGTTTPIIFMTSFPSETLRNQALERGAYGFLNKPFDERTLLDCLKRALLQRKHNH